MAAKALKLSTIVRPAEPDNSVEMLNGRQGIETSQLTDLADEKHRVDILNGRQGIETVWSPSGAFVRMTIVDMLNGRQGIETSLCRDVSGFRRKGRHAEWPSRY